jgi:hypothetical protein
MPTEQPFHRVSTCSHVTAEFVSRPIREMRLQTFLQPACMQIWDPATNLISRGALPGMWNRLAEAVTSNEAILTHPV